MHTHRDVKYDVKNIKVEVSKKINVLLCVILFFMNVQLEKKTSKLSNENRKKS